MLSALEILPPNGEVQRPQLTYNTQPMTFIRPLPRSVGWRSLLGILRL